MAIGVKALPLSVVAHALALAGAVMVLVWCIHFRGGLAWDSSNKNLIFNVCFQSLLSSVSVNSQSWLPVEFCLVSGSLTLSDIRLIWAILFSQPNFIPIKIQFSFGINTHFTEKYKSCFSFSPKGS